MSNKIKVGVHNEATNGYLFSRLGGLKNVKEIECEGREGEWVYFEVELRDETKLKKYNKKLLRIFN